MDHDHTRPPIRLHSGGGNTAPEYTRPPEMEMLIASTGPDAAVTRLIRVITALLILYGLVLLPALAIYTYRWAL